MPVNPLKPVDRAILLTGILEVLYLESNICNSMEGKL